ncbi:MAG TPA: RNA 2',3'-cyclic phosphodiesterase [Segeticoccus sp.]|jgi:2'-5' RNA ligase|nr:RNA 2',3'-cyclic phosphodiesterase [Segeticoccus sp.]
MRMFAAITPSPEAVEDLAEFLEPRREVDSPLRWTLPDQWHVTVAFMAQVPERSLDDLTDRLARAAKRRTPWSCRIAGAGAFPDPADGKVLWAGVEAQDDHGAEELRRLATGARAAAGKAGADVDGGRFHPHLTLARLRHRQELTRWLRVFDAYRGPVWAVTELVLVESRLGEGPNGKPRYDTVETFPLGG